MRIPDNQGAREGFYAQIVRKCSVSLERRADNYSLFRHYYLFGRGPDEDECAYNKIYPHIDLLRAYLFAAESTRFAIHLGPHIDEIEYKRVRPMERAINDAWLYSNADQEAGMAITGGLTYGAMAVKLIVKVNEQDHSAEIHPFVVHPSCLGVLREDMPQIERQEAIVHSYYMTRSALELELENHPRRAQILEDLSFSPIASQPADLPPGIERIVMAAVTPNLVGNVNLMLGDQIDYQPEVDEPLVEMQELWILDSKTKDYRVVTRAGNTVTLYDRPNFFLPGEVPFALCVPSPLISNLWGVSEVHRLIPLQRWRNERTAQIRKLMSLQVRPPTSLTGWDGLLDEKTYALFSEGSTLSASSPVAKVERYAPEMPPDIFNDLHENDMMFAEASGIQNIMQGKGEVGLRSGRQTSELARLGSARIKQRALNVEDFLERLATLYLKIMQTYDGSEYEDEDGKSFTAKQFSAEAAVRVDGHSNSPLFIEDHRAMADELLKTHCISRETYIDMIGAPNAELLKRDLKKIEAAEQQAAQAKLAQVPKKAA